MGVIEHGRSQEVVNAPVATLRCQRRLDPGRVGGGNETAGESSLVDAALICKEFLNLRHVIECGLLSGL